MKEQYSTYYIVGILFLLFLFFLLKKIKRQKSIIKKLTKNIDVQNKIINELNNKNNILEKKRKELELKNLRFTLNPHSFRNTLNSIEFVAQRTLDSIQNLSTILDYMLYEAFNNQFVSLNDEIDFAKKYFDLYKVMANSRVRLNLDINQKLYEYPNLKIAPLITANFIENAFKHADLNSKGSFIFLKIDFIPPSHIIYSIENKIKKNKADSSQGLGNKSFHELLTILYNNKHYFESSIKEDTFKAVLKIDLQ